MEIREASMEDIEQIQELSAHWNGDGQPVDSYILEKYLDSEIVICADDGENIFGVTMLEQNADGSMHIARFFVHPDYRDDGIGSEMMDVVTEYLDDNCTTAFASVALTNPAMNLYERYGFAETNAYKAPYEDQIAMEREPASDDLTL